MRNRTKTISFCTSETRRFPVFICHAQTTAPVETDGDVLGYQRDSGLCWAVSTRACRAACEKISAQAEGN